jgi:AraC-like DNA-binding protein
MTKKEELRVNPPEINVPSQDEKFMEAFRAEIEKILSDTSDESPEFSIDAICDKLEISRAQFFKRVKVITGVTPNEYIMPYRLERAAQLLIQKYGNVTQVALAVGFENPNYFSKRFKKKFGLSPTAFKRSYKAPPPLQVKINIEFTLEELDRELVLRLPLPNLEKLFNNKVGTPQRSEIYESIKNFYKSVAPNASNKTPKYITPTELMQKMQMKIDDLNEDAFKAGRYLLKSMDTYEIEKEQVIRNARSVAAVCMIPGLIPCGKGFSKLETVSFGETFNLCLSEPFFDQPIWARSMCTGVLVAEDVIVTATHFVNEKNLMDICFVFGFVMKDPITPTTKVPNENIYKGVEILQRAPNPECDWALVKLDRKVLGGGIATLSKNKVFNEQPIYIIGHPCGLPLKFASGAYVEDCTENYFKSDLDIYSGNSGSPVFCAQTHEVIGIVSRIRPANLRWTGNCLISLSYPGNALNPFRSQCTRTTEFIKYVLPF